MLRTFRALLQACEFALVSLLRPWPLREPLSDHARQRKEGAVAPGGAIVADVAIHANAHKLGRAQNEPYAPYFRCAALRFRGLNVQNIE